MNMTPGEIKNFMWAAFGGVFIVIGPQTYFLRGSAVAVPNKVGGGRISTALDRDQNAPRDINSASSRGTPDGRRRHAPVMKIPTLEFRLTLEIFAELCGCRRVDFF